MASASRRVVSAGVALVLALAAGVAEAQEPSPDAPVPPGSLSTVLDLQSTILDLGTQTLELRYRTEAVAGAIQALEVKESATEIRIELAADVLFDFDKADLRADAAPVLTQAAEFVRQQGRPRLTIEGHTDGKGTASYNQRLSERRAAAVRRWLETRGGVRGVAMTTRGWGATKPVAPNAKPDGSDDPAGRQKNRRVEIIIAR
jgi:outer membrane protein OmpA-like peptidoglycan-associated protein